MRRPSSRGSADGEVDATGPAWIVVAGGPIDGTAGLAPALAEVLDSLRTAERIGRRGWIDDAGELAVERLLLATRSWRVGRRP